MFLGKKIKIMYLMVQIIDFFYLSLVVHNFAKCYRISTVYLLETHHKERLCLRLTCKGIHDSDQRFVCFAL